MEPRQLQAEAFAQRLADDAVIDATPGRARLDALRARVQACAAEEPVDIAVADNTEPIGTGQQQPSSKEPSHQQASSSWVPSAKRDALLRAISDRFQAILTDSPEDIEKCRVFWQHTDDLHCRLQYQEIPKRLRSHMVGYAYKDYERILCNWLRSGAKTLTENKIAHIMLAALNELIIATNPSAAAGDTHFSPASSKHVTTPPTSKRNYESMATGLKEEAKPKRKVRRAVRTPQSILGRQSQSALNFTGNLVDSVQQTSTALAKWHELVSRQHKGSLAAELVQVASACATTLAMVKSSELLEEVRQNSRLLATVAFTIHKLVQFAATLVQPLHAYNPLTSCLYFVRLSAGEAIRVSQTCYTSILTSVDLLSKVWPQGFSNFKKLEDMPVRPSSALSGHLYDYLGGNMALKNLCRTLRRNLFQQMSTKKDGILLSCSLQSIENLLFLFKDSATNAGEMQNERSSIEPSAHGDFDITHFDISHVSAKDTGNNASMRSSPKGRSRDERDDTVTVTRVDTAAKTRPEDPELIPDLIQAAAAETASKDVDPAAISSDEEDTLITSLQDEDTLISSLVAL